MEARVPPSSTGPEGAGQVVIYRDGATRLQVRLEGRTVWLSQRLIAELFQVSVPTVNEHLAGIYAERELDRDATVRSFRIVQLEGSRDVSRAVEHYSLDAILAIGYRVRSRRGTPPAQCARGRHAVRAAIRSLGDCSRGPGPWQSGSTRSKRSPA